MKCQLLLNIQQNSTSIVAYFSHAIICLSHNAEFVAIRNEILYKIWVFIILLKNKK